MTASSTAIEALHAAWRLGQTEEFDRILSSRELPPPDETDDYGRTALWLSAAVGSVLGTKLFLDRGADLEFRCPATGHSPLHAAVFRHRSDTVRALLARGASPDARDPFAQTPLMLACLGGWDDLAELLLEVRAAVNLTDINGRTALHLAVARRRTGIVRRLLAGGASVDVQDENGVTPLMTARNLECVRLLLDYGASADLRDCSGLTVRDHMRRRPQVLALLQERS